MELIATRKFTVFGRSRRCAKKKHREGGANGELVGCGKDVPTVRLREMNSANASRFVGLMEKHGFVVLTETGAIREAYLEFMRLLKEFFGGDADWKETCKGGVHFNERGIPMWHAGYERCGRVREAFRVPAGGSSSSSLPPEGWPCPHLRRAWLAVLRLLQRVCHRALTLTLGRTVRGAPGGLIVSDGEGREGEAAPAAAAGEDDFSVSYALHYPNEFADPALEEEDLTVGEHVDPSLFVAEPCCGVEGLEIRDRSSESWIPVEALCAGLGSDGRRSFTEAEGRELVLFGGKALERATEGRIRGAPHRVRRGDMGRRYCFIYEQKYAEFFPPPALD